MKTGKIPVQEEESDNERFVRSCVSGN